MPVNKLIDKLMLLILCGLGVLFTGVSAEVIGALLIAVTVSALNSYSEQKTVIPVSYTHLDVYKRQITQ